MLLIWTFVYVSLDTSNVWKADVKYLMRRQNVDFNKSYIQQHGPVITNVVHAVRFPCFYLLIDVLGKEELSSV